MEPLREGADFTLYRGSARGDPTPILVVAVASEHPSPQSLKRLEHEYSLASELDAAWAAQPLALLCCHLLQFLADFFSTLFIERAALYECAFECAAQIV